ncbi:unnamed protein product [Pleuronectes platessa]|uniref:Uncharacterized protein n=1 Tax=Pleuronectes platessa TaxID=8262 RepID=A0A9N7U5F6_PLEPL|nr:unnamed protein product [Pleuronectes platessa]
MAESRAARGNRGFSQPRSIFLVPDTPRDLFPLLIRLASRIFSPKQKKRQALGLINCLLQRATEEAGRPVFSHAAPLSRMVTTAAPCNPFLRLPVSHTDTRGDIRQSR